MSSSDPPQKLGFTAVQSTPRFPHEPKPPAAAPNVVAIVLDDTGFAHLGNFGSDIDTPHLDELATHGARFNRFHVTSLCSPTRAAFFTGRNHHAVGMGFLADIPLGYPGYTARLPKSAAALPRILRDAGYSTLAVGKWHLTPRWQRSAAGPFTTWPLGVGFERYYGFLQGDANHWAPNLVRDNHYTDPPRRPEEGYHLSEDLADQAIRMVRDQQQGAPGKPFFLYFALGAMHSPHHVAPEWVEPYRGKFDGGWDVWRREAFARQLQGGIVPPGTVLTERPSWVQGWDELSTDERRMHARQQEVFAGFLTHTDAQIGRVLDSLDTSGLLNETLVMVFSDNGASAEGGKDGSVNEHRFTAHFRESVADNLAAYDDWGGFTTYNHYSWAWAWAGNTPHKLWKRYTWLGGTRTPLIVHWPGHIARPGGVRSQFAHVIDLMPTILDAVGVDPPDEVDGVAQQHIDGTSLVGVLEDAARDEVHQTQYFEMLGSRSIYHDGWKATTNHVSLGVLDEEELAVGSRSFDEDRWELFNLSEDFSEARNQADEEPDRLRHLTALWSAEAERNQVLPVSDGLWDRMGALILPAWPTGTAQTYRPGGGPVHDESVPRLWGGFVLTAEIESIGQKTEGVVCALGDWFGGYALFVVDGVAHFTFARAADALQLSVASPMEVGRRQITVSYRLSADGGPGQMELAVDGQQVDDVPVEGMLPLAIQHGGRGCGWVTTAGSPSPPCITRRPRSAVSSTSSGSRPRVPRGPTPTTRCVPHYTETERGLTSGAMAPALTGTNGPCARGHGAAACEALGVSSSNRVESVSALGGAMAAAPLRLLQDLAGAGGVDLSGQVRRAIGIGRPPVRMAMDPTEAYLRPDGAARMVHSDLPSMLIGGISALLLQTLHPLAMAGVAEHSNYQADPLGRLRRTADFVGTTTFGTVQEAQKALEQVRRVHRRVSGLAPDGRPYSADDPELVTFIHAAEVSSFLESSRRFGPRDLTPEQCDQYYEEVAPVAIALGAEWVPRSVAEMTEYFRRVRPELHAGPQALQARDWLRHGVSRRPEQRAVYAVLYAAAVSILPVWGRRELGLSTPAHLDLLLDTVAVIPRSVSAGLRWLATPRTARAGPTEPATA